MLPSVSMIQTVSTNHPPNPPLTAKKFQDQIIPTLNSPSVSSFSLSTNRANHRPRRISATSSVLDEPNGRTEAKEKLRVVVKPVERPRLVLKFIWMEKNIGIALDQFIPGGHGTIPLSPYYLWPRKDAWEELKIMLESKAWISQKQMVILLNQATDIINLWQQNGGG